MIAEKMKSMVANSSAIRAMFEEPRMYMISAWATRMCRLRRR